MQLIFPVSTRDHSIGPIDAPITLVEYGQYECSYCRSVEQTVRTLQIEFSGQLRRVFRHFPRTTTYSLSGLAAEASEIAASKGKFWQMHEALLTRRENLSEGTLVACATTIGLNLPQFVHDLMGHVHRERVEQDFHSGIENGLISTPTFFINGIRHDDEASIDVLRAAITASIQQTTANYETVRTEFATRRNDRQITGWTAYPFSERVASSFPQ